MSGKIGPNDLGPAHRKIRINRVVKDCENEFEMEVDLNGYVKRVKLDKSNFEYPELIREGDQNLEKEIPEQTIWDKGLLP